MSLRRIFERTVWCNATKLVGLNLRMVVDRVRGSKAVILNLEHVTLLPFMLPVIEQLRKMTNRVSYYVCLNTIGPELSELEITSSHVFVSHWSRYAFAANMFLSPDIWGKAPSCVLKVHLPHGHPVKFASLPKDQFEHFDVHLVTGPLHREQTESTILQYGIKRNIRIYDVGLPKSDKLMNGGYDRRAVLDSLGLDSDRLTLIYAPSWEDGLSLRSFGKRLFDQFTALDGVNLVIKLHPVSCVSPDHPQYALYTGSIDWVEFVRGYLRYPHMRLVITDDIDPLLAASDIMITDLSGAALEFLALIKPVIYLDCPEFFSRVLTSLYADFGPTNAEYVCTNPMSNAGRHVGYVLSSLDDLRSAVQFLIEHPDYKLTERQEYAARLRYNNGQAAYEAAKTILRLLDLRHPSDLT